MHTAYGNTASHHTRRKSFSNLKLWLAAIHQIFICFFSPHIFHFICISFSAVDAMNLKTKCISFQITSSACIRVSRIHKVKKKTLLNGLIIAWQYDNVLSTHRIHRRRRHRLADTNFKIFINFSLSGPFHFISFVVVHRKANTEHRGRFNFIKLFILASAYDVLSGLLLYCEETNMNRYRARERETFTDLGMLVGVVLFTENRAEGKLYGSTHVDE